MQLEELQPQENTASVYMLGELNLKEATILPSVKEREHSSKNHEELPKATVFTSGLPNWSPHSSCKFNGQTLSLCLGINYNEKELISLSRLSLQRGTIYGLVGKNGTGKSSLGKLLVSKALPDFPANLSTSYLSTSSSFGGSFGPGNLSVKEFMLHSAEEKEKEIQRRIEHLEEAFEELLEKEANDESLEFISMRIGELYDKRGDLINSYSKKVEETLEQLGFLCSNLAGTAVNKLSCGWRYKCQLATLLLTRPDVLVIDEPCFLDEKSNAWLVYELKQMAKTTQAIVIMISHKEELLEAVCENILFINPVSKTLLVYSCSYKNFMRAHGEKVIHAARILENVKKENETVKKSLKAYTLKAETKNRGRMKKLEISKNKTHDCKSTGRSQMGGGKMGKSIAAKARQLSLKSYAVQESSQNYKKEKVVPLRLEGSTLDCPPKGTTLISVQEISFGYEQSPCILSNVSTQIYCKDRILLQGGNGEGKSTLIKLLLKKLQPDSGSIFVHPQARLNSRIVYFPQTALEDLLNQHGSDSSYLFLQSMHVNLSGTKIRTHLGKFGIQGEMALRPIRSLSSGQMVRLYLAKELLNPLSSSSSSSIKPYLLVLDEVTENLDRESVDSFLETLNEFPGAVICISHDEYFIDKFSTSTLTQSWRLSNGKLKIGFK